MFDYGPALTCIECNKRVGSPLLVYRVNSADCSSYSMYFCSMLLSSVQEQTICVYSHIDQTLYFPDNLIPMLFPKTLLGNHSYHYSVFVSHSGNLVPNLLSSHHFLQRSTIKAPLMSHLFLKEVQRESHEREVQIVTGDENWTLRRRRESDYKIVAMEN